MSSQDRLLDLLSSGATQGLSPAQLEEVERLLAEQTALGPDDLDLAAASADLAFQSSQPKSEPMPTELRQRILAQAEKHLVSQGSEDHDERAVLPFHDRRPSKPGPFGVRYLGWYAAAAMLLLALWAPWSSRTTPTPPLVEQRAGLIAGAPDVIEVAWAPSEVEGYGEVRGDVVWSNEKQAGFMRLRGLPANRPTQQQYQLWIVDPSRDQHPIDGGVFDIPAGRDEVIVPIVAKLDVADPKVFAITLEQPGGVVVSAGPLLVVAPVQT